MLRALRIFLALVVTVAACVLPWGAAGADPGKGKGRGHSRAQEREQESESDDTSSEEEEAPQEAEPSEESQTDEGSGARSRPQRKNRSEPQDGSEPEDEAPGREDSEGDGGASDGQDDGESSEAQGVQRKPRPSRTSQKTGAAEVIDLSFAASPASIAVGETSALTVTATNPGTNEVSSLEVLVDLPAHLELVSSEPVAGASDGVVTLDLGPLAPGASVTGSVIVAGSSVPRGDIDPVRFAVTIDDRVAHHELYVEVASPAGGPIALSQSSPLLLQVGDTAAFSITVANPTDAALSDVAVVTEIAPEVDVVGVAPIERADAIQLGSSPSREDIVWLFEELAPAEEVVLTWSGRAVAPGDLEASNVVEARVGRQVEAQSAQSTYLGYVKGVRTDAGTPRTKPVVVERVVTKLVPVTTQVAAAPAGILPVTGSSPAVVAGAGLLLVLLGAGALWRSSRSSRRGRLGRSVLVAVALGLLTGTACVSDTDPAPQVQSSPTDADQSDQREEPASDDSETDEVPEDEVLGLRIDKPRRGDGQDAVDGPEGPAPGTSLEEAPEPTVPEVSFEEVTEVVSVLVPPEELPLETMASAPGENTISLTLSESDGETVTSGRVITADATEALLASFTSSGDVLSSTVSLTNLAEDRRLAVGGYLVLNVTASSGQSSVLRSERVDAVLEPGGSTSAVLSFSLPPGSYSLQGGFEAD